MILRLFLHILRKRDRKAGHHRIPCFGINMITTRYYYNQLNQRNKKIYKAIYTGIMNYEQDVEVPGVNLDEHTVGWVYHCVLWDNPYIFNVGEYAMWNAVSSDKSRIKMATLCDADTEKRYRKQVENEVNRILSVPGLQKMTDFQKEVFVHDFVINNIQYDQTSGNDGKRIQPYTVYGALVERRAVCEGIAKTVKLLLNLLDVKCIVVSGKYDGHAHAWNIVKINDWTYNLDVTMDMGRVVNPGMMRYNYFNFRNSDISNYEVDNAQMIPKCRAIEYNYLIKTAGFVSNYDRLKKYIENCLKKKKTCMYFKQNKNVDDQFTNMSFVEFQEVVDKAYSEVTNAMNVSTSRFVDSTGPNDIISMEISYL